MLVFSLARQLGIDAALGCYLLKSLFPLRASFERYILSQGSTVAVALVDLGHVDECVVFFEVILHSPGLLRKLSSISAVFQIQVAA